MQYYFWANFYFEKSLVLLFHNKIFLINLTLNQIRFCFNFFQTEFTYPNGTKISVKKIELLDAIPGDASNDRLFINSAYFIFFTEKRIRKQAKNGLTCAQTLNKLRNSIKYELMRDIYEYRVMNDGDGDIKSRIRIFGHIFRVKLNNWWRSNVKKADA